jgi:uncharacterized membrane protein
MSKPKRPPVRCLLCDQEKTFASCFSSAAVRAPLASFIAKRHPECAHTEGYYCLPCLNAERSAFVLEELEKERGELSAVEAEVSRKATEHSAIAAHLDQHFQKSLTLGQHLADSVARVGGSWPFVTSFCAALVAWVILNSLLLATHAFDPYPYILLNLVLSCVAALQAPIIMMSQNRQAARDRLEADEDYKVNLKAELEIAALHDKVDHLLHVQWERMMELQQTQLDLLQDIAGRRH